MKKHILIIGAWSEVLEYAIELDFKVSYIGNLQVVNELTSKAQDQILYKYQADIDKSSVCLYYAKQIAENLSIDAVFSFSEIGLETAAIIKDNLKIKNGLDLLPTFITKYKDLFRAYFIKNSNLTLPYKFVKSSNDIVDFFKKEKHIIVKPTSGAGSVGIYIISNQEELDKYLISNSNFNNLIVEKYINSNILYSVESISINGKHNIIALSSSYVFGNPYSLQDHILVPPYKIDDSLKIKISDKVKNMLSLLDYNNGVAHTEIKVENDNPYIVETQTRVGGDRIWKMVELTTGFSQIKTLYNSIKNENIEITDFPKTKAYGAFLCLLAKSGKVKNYSNLDFLDNIPEVLEYQFNISKDKILTEIKDNTQRTGYIFITSDNQQKLLSLIDDIYKKIWIEYYDNTKWIPQIQTSFY